MNPLHFTPEDLASIQRHPTGKVYYEWALAAHEELTRALTNLAMILFITQGEGELDEEAESWSVHYGPASPLPHNNPA